MPAGSNCPDCHIKHFPPRSTCPDCSLSVVDYKNQLAIMNQSHVPELPLSPPIEVIIFSGK